MRKETVEKIKAAEAAIYEACKSVCVFYDNQKGEGGEISSRPDCKEISLKDYCEKNNRAMWEGSIKEDFEAFQEKRKKNYDLSREEFLELRKKYGLEDSIPLFGSLSDQVHFNKGSEEIIKNVYLTIINKKLPDADVEERISRINEMNFQRRGEIIIKLIELQRDFKDFIYEASKAMLEI